jgi:Tfp pilus assembly protein PilP
MATLQNKIAVGTAGVKGVRIGMDGKTPPTTSVVVDLEHAIGYELAPGPGNKFFLNLHTAQEITKNTPAKTSSASAQTAAVKAVAITPPAGPKVAVAAVSASTGKLAPVAKSAAAKTATTNASANKPVAGVPGTTPKIAIAAVSAPMSKVDLAAKGAAGTKATSKPEVATTKIAAQQNAASVIKKVEAPKPPVVEPKKWAMNGKRDPFFSPVVQQNSGSGCSTGKKCLDIGQINVRGVVKADSGFIAVVTNSLNKAYFLHENDPVFNGFVVKITGDSVVFQETMQDKLGKPFTREVTKRITTPAV